MSDKQSVQQNQTPGERLKAVRKQSRLSRAYIEKQHHLPAATLKAWENDVIKLTEKGLTRCIDIYRKEGVVLTRAWVMDGVGLPPKISVDLGRYFASDIQYAPAASGSEKAGVRELDQPPHYDVDDELCRVREASHFKVLYPDAVVLMVTNDDMGSVYQPGDYVGGRFREVNDIAGAVGKDCIVRLQDGRDILRRVFKSRISDGYNLACINPLTTSTEPVIFDAKIERVAPIIWHRKPDD